MKKGDFHYTRMPSPEAESRSTQPQPLSPTGHPLPRRTAAADSVTLEHHRLARDASIRAGASSEPVVKSNATSLSPRRDSSGESHETGQSDPKQWFDKSNENPTAIFDSNTKDGDPPFFQKESDSSNEDKPDPYKRPAVHPRPTAQSSSADDYRSVIDDLTVEIQKLREELKRYKQKGPDMMRKDKLFEIKIHGLPKSKKMELDSTLRDFAASLHDYPDASSSQQRKSSRRANRGRMYSASGSASKHASSSSGSNARPVDSAYASMSTGARSSGTHLGRPNDRSSRVKSSEQKVESYLRDIPEGLYPRHMAMTEQDRKSIAVRRLEQLFTGKLSGRHARRGQNAPPRGAAAVSVPAGRERQPQDQQQMQQTSARASAAEPVREAKIASATDPVGGSGQTRAAKDNTLPSRPSGDQSESSAKGNSTHSGTNVVASNSVSPTDQRPTRPEDLDPDRAQVPSENMDYIRHLGLVPPELLPDATATEHDVHPDADGWVYLNLLCSMAQLHIINVTPSFVRSAVSELSTKLQLSPDGRKIRWRGGSEGTRFASDSSGDSSQRSPDTDGTTSSDKGRSRKRQKTRNSTDECQSGNSGKNGSKFGPQISDSSASFHYIPLFVQQESTNGQTSPDDTLLSSGPIEDSNFDESRMGLSGAETSVRRKRRNDGAIIYYSGAPFCTDLSGDPGDVSPTAHMRSSGENLQDHLAHFSHSLPYRSDSGSSLSYRPLRDGHGVSPPVEMDVDSSNDPPELTADSSDAVSEMDFDLPWASEQQYMEVRPLEPCGLGGVLPDDHFMVVVTTKRPKEERHHLASADRSSTTEAADGVMSRLAPVSASLPAQPMTQSPSRSASPAIEIEYVSGRIKRLAPVPLPPPAIFFRQFSTDDSSEWDDDLKSDSDEDPIGLSDEVMSREAHHSIGYPDGVDLTSGDEDGEDPELEADARQIYDMNIYNQAGGSDDVPTRKSIDSTEAAPGSDGGRSKTASETMARAGASSNATAGGR